MSRWCCCDVKCKGVGGGGGGGGVGGDGGGSVWVDVTMVLYGR